MTSMQEKPQTQWADTPGFSSKHWVSLRYSPWTEQSIGTQLAALQSQSQVWLCVTPRTAARRASCPSPSPGVCPSSSPLSQWCHPTISSSVIPFSSCPQSFPASRSFPMSRLLEWPKYCSLSFSIVLSGVFKVDFLKDWLLCSPCCPRGSQESSPTPQYHCKAAILQ